MENALSSKWGGESTLLFVLFMAVFVCNICVYEKEKVRDKPKNVCGL